jgi:hypothetical protein
MNEIQEVLLIKLIIIDSVIDWIKINKFAIKGDFIVVNINELNKLIIIIILIIIQYIF